MAYAFIVFWGKYIIFQSYVCRVALADKSMRLRILIIDMFRFKLWLQKLKVPPEFLFQNGIGLGV